MARLRVLRRLEARELLLALVDGGLELVDHAAAEVVCFGVELAQDVHPDMAVQVSEPGSFEQQNELHTLAVDRSQRGRFRLSTVEDVHDGVDVVAGVNDVCAKFCRRPENFLT